MNKIFSIHFASLWKTEWQNELLPRDQKKDAIFIFDFDRFLTCQGAYCPPNCNFHLASFISELSKHKVENC